MVSMACTSRRTQKSSILGEVPPRNPTSYPFIYHFWRKRYPFRIPSIDNWYAFHIPSLEPVADPGKGPGPNRIFRPNWGPKGRKIFFFLGGGTAPLPVFKGLDDRTPPPPTRVRIRHWQRCIPLTEITDFPLKPEKGTPFRRSPPPPLIGHYREYPPGGLHREVNGRGVFNTGESL